MMERFYLGLTLISFLITGISFIPFINFLYQLKFIRRKEGIGKKKSLFDKLHDWKAGTPIGGGILVIALTSIIYLLVALFFIKTKEVSATYPLVDEIHILLLTFLSFGLLGLLDDWTKIFGKPRKGKIGFVFERFHKRICYGNRNILMSCSLT